MGDTFYGEKHFTHFYQSKELLQKKFATTQADLLFIEIMLRFSHVKQMYSQPINLTDRLILCTEIGVNNKKALFEHSFF